MSRGDRAIVYRAGPASPATAGLLSAVCAGGGQLLNRQYAKGALFMAAYAAALIVAVPRIARALQGLVTLGDTPTRIVDGVLVRGDHSIFLLINGLLALFAGAALLMLHALNVADAYRHRAAAIASGGLVHPRRRSGGEAAAATAPTKLGSSIRPSPTAAPAKGGWHCCCSRRRCSSSFSYPSCPCFSTS